MFQECHKLEKLDINFDASHVSNMEGMFNKCHELKEIKGLNKFNTSKVINMKEMSQESKKIISLELNFDTYNAINMGWMFNGCHELKEIKGINKFKTAKVCNMNSYKLNNLELYFYTYNVIDMD